MHAHVKFSFLSYKFKLYNSVFGINCRSNDLRIVYWSIIYGKSYVLIFSVVFRLELNSVELLTCKLTFDKNIVFEKVAMKKNGDFMKKRSIHFSLILVCRWLPRKIGAEREHHV